MSGTFGTFNLLYFCTIDPQTQPSPNPIPSPLRLHFIYTKYISREDNVVHSCRIFAPTCILPLFTQISLCLFCLACVFFCLACVFFASQLKIHMANLAKLTNLALFSFVFNLFIPIRQRSFPSFFQYRWKVLYYLMYARTHAYTSTHKKRQLRLIVELPFYNLYKVLIIVSTSKSHLD